EAIQLEKQIHAIVSDLRDLSTDGEDKLTKEQQVLLEDSKKKLKELLDQQFEMRQKLEIEELKQLRDRLDRLDKEISDRSKNRESMIDRQMKDLLSGNPSATLTAIGNVKVVTQVAPLLDNPNITIDADKIEIQTVPAAATPEGVRAPTVAPAPAAVPAPTAVPAAPAEPSTPATVPEANPYQR
ncbi:MAG TPA: hypothetical protein VGI75_14545, partial [Pirellulales bacterium]